MPLISILLPVYNGELFLSETITSILNQTFTEFEFIIINDGSTDKTEEIILSYSDSRIVYVKNEQNVQLIATLNKGLRLCNGKYIARIDADDIALPNRLEEQLCFMEKNPEIGVCGSWVETIGLEQNRIVQFHSDHDLIRMELLLHNYLHHPSVMIRNSILTNHKLQYPNCLHAEDYAMWVQLAKHTKFHILPKVLLKYRMHENSIGAQYNDIQLQQSAIIRKNQYEDLGIECDEKYEAFEKWIGSSKTDNIKEAYKVILFLTFLFKKCIANLNVDKKNAQRFFSKHVWPIACEYPSLKTFLLLKSTDLIDSSISLTNKLKLFTRSLIP